MIRLWVRYSAVDMTITTIIIIIITSGRTDRKIGLTAIKKRESIYFGHCLYLARMVCEIFRINILSHA